MSTGYLLKLCAATVAGAALSLAVAVPTWAVTLVPPTPPITTPESAHAAVLATGAPFDGFVALTSDLIGASNYYEVKGDAGSSADWIVVYTYGWGDCQAGCIGTHSFTYQVDPATGAATFISSQGPSLPTTAPEALRTLSASGGGGAASPSPDWGALYEQWYNDFVASLPDCAPGVDPTDPSVTTCRQPDGSVVGPIPLWAPAPRPGPWPVDGGGTRGDDGWIQELPKIILAALLAWVGGAALVGWSKSRGE